jgi:clan AA aspartic protease (TIGR02281 family)
MQKTITLALLLACGPAQAESIQLIREHGTFVVPVLINNKITLNFTLDSGASDVSIPADVFSTLTRAGTVSKGDFLDIQVYELADGSKQTSQRFRIRSLRIGSFELRNVIASVAPSAGSLLLGQSFLSRLKSWSIDNDRQLLVFDESTNSDVAPTAVRPELRTGTGTTRARPSSSPMETDMHAAYCTEVIRNLIGFAESMLSQDNSYSTVPNVDDTAAMRTDKAKLEAANRKVKAGLDSNQNRLSRLNLYLVPRLTDRNVIGIVGAKNTAKNDIARMNALATSGTCSECTSPDLDTSETTKCMNECATRVMPDFPSIQNKRQSCQNLEWLP